MSSHSNPEVVDFRLNRLDSDVKNIQEEIVTLRKERTQDLKESVKWMRGIFIAVALTLLATALNLLENSGAHK